MPWFYHPRDEHLRAAVTFLTPADTELFTSDMNLALKSLFVFLILLQCLAFQRAVGKGKVQMVVFRDLGSASMGCRRGRAGHHPTVPLYLAHSTPHGFSVPRIKIRAVSPSPRLPANKHPKFPGRMVRSDPFQEQGEGKHARRGASRALAHSAHLQAAPAGPAAALEGKGAESAWCREGEDEIKIWGHGKAQVSLLASLGFHSLLGRNNSLIPAALKLQHSLQNTNFPGTNLHPSPRSVPPGCQRQELCKKQGKAEFQPSPAWDCHPRDKFIT